MTKLSRRVFLGAAPAAAAEAAIKWDDTYNVIVIGAGLSAAVSAKKQAARKSLFLKK